MNSVRTPDPLIHRHSKTQIHSAVKKDFVTKQMDIGWVKTWGLLKANTEAASCEES